MTQHIFDRVVLLNKLVCFDMPDSTDRLTVITSTQDAHINELHIERTVDDYFILCQLHIFQQLSQIHL